MNPENKPARYDASRYRTPDGAPADIVIFTITTEEGEAPGKNKSLPDRTLQVLLIQRKKWPDAGKWALPGGFSRPEEQMIDAAKRELREETNVDNVHIELLGVYSKLGRDPRGWMISTAYVALVNEHCLAARRANDDAADVRLFPVEEALEKLGQLEDLTDHVLILQDALQKVRQQMLQTAIAKEFLPDEFTLSELYQVLRTVVPSFQDDNFIRKNTATRSREGILAPVLDDEGRPKTSTRYSQRPAKLYRFTGYVPELSIYG